MFKLFSLKGIRVAAHWSLLLAVGLFAWRAGSVTAGAVTAALLFASVLLHEFGHAFVARRLGVPIREIDLHVFGGAAKMEKPPSSPRDEGLIAIAGPLVSLALAGASGLAAMFSPVGAGIFSFLAIVNMTLFVFNLLPALPMDGGRVLRAILAQRKGFVAGTRSAITVGRIVAVAMGVAGVVYDPWLLLMAFVIWNLGRGESAQVDRSIAMERLGMGFADPWRAYRRSAAPKGGVRSVGAGGSVAVPVEPDDVLMPDGRSWSRTPV